MKYKDKEIEISQFANEKEGFIELENIDIKNDFQQDSSGKDFRKYFQFRIKITPDTTAKENAEIDKYKKLFPYNIFQEDTKRLKIILTSFTI